MLILTCLGKTSIRSLDPSTFITTWPLGQPCKRKLFHTDYAVERCMQMTKQQEPGNAQEVVLIKV